jgi:hypothetical protein
MGLSLVEQALKAAVYPDDDCSALPSGIAIDCVVSQPVGILQNIIF